MKKFHIYVDTSVIGKKGARLGFNVMYMRYLDFSHDEFAARAIDEIGRLVRGWMKAQRAAANSAITGAAS